MVKVNLICKLSNAIGTLHRKNKMSYVKYFIIFGQKQIVANSLKKIITNCHANYNMPSWIRLLRDNWNIKFLNTTKINNLKLNWSISTYLK